MTRVLISSLVALAAGLSATSALAQAEDDNSGFNQFYIGGSFGGSHTARTQDSISFDRNLDGSFGDTVSTAGGANAFSPGFCSGTATSTANGNCSFRRDGIEYYGKIGGDTQRGRVVVGFVVEGGRPDFNESVSGFSTTPASYTITRDVRFNINARGRLGYTPNDSTLFYAAGGPTFARVRLTNATSNTANSFTTNGDQDAWGFNVGGGVEQKLGNNFSIGLEYLYTDINADRNRVRVGPGTAPATNPFLLGNPAGTDFRFSNQNMRWHSARVTAALRF
ncbi:MAG: outer membrane beta-barrel protein [Sphingomonadales bacterium]